MSNSLWPHGLQHTRLSCAPLSPRVYSNSYPLMSCQWCHPTISSSVVPFSCHLHSFPASGSFPMSQLFVSGGQSIGASTSASVLLMDIQGWFPLGLTSWYLCSPRDSQESPPEPQFKSISLSVSACVSWWLPCLPLSNDSCVKLLAEQPPRGDNHHLVASKLLYPCGQAQV